MFLTIFALVTLGFRILINFLLFVLYYFLSKNWFLFAKHMAIIVKYLISLYIYISSTKSA